MATELSLVLLFKQDVDDLDIDRIIRLTEQATDSDVTEWDTEEV